MARKISVRGMEYTRDNRRTVGSGVICAVRAEVIYRYSTWNYPINLPTYHHIFLAVMRKKKHGHESLGTQNQEWRCWRDQLEFTRSRSAIPTRVHIRNLSGWVVYNTTATSAALCAIYQGAVVLSATCKQNNLMNHVHLLNFAQVINLMPLTF